MEISELIENFTSNGLTLRPNACKYLKTNILDNSNISAEKIESYIQGIINRITNLDGVDTDVKLDENGVVDVDMIELCLKELEGKHKAKENKPFMIVDCFNDCQKYNYWELVFRQKNVNDFFQSFILYIVNKFFKVYLCTLK